MGDNRCSTGSGTTAHPGGDETHLGAGLEHVLNFANAFFGGLASYFWICAGTQALCQRSTELDLIGHRAVIKGLRVGIADHEIYTIHANILHVVHRIGSTAAYSDDLDHRAAVFGEVELQSVVHHIILRLRRFLTNL